MRSRLTQIGLSVLLLALQSLQPLMAWAPCSQTSDGGASSCCCCEGEAGPVELSSCCEELPLESQEAPEPSCGCALTPDQPLTPPPADYEGTRLLLRAAASEIPGAALQDPRQPSPASWGCQPVDPVAEGPPLRLLIQVFRL